MNLPHFFLKLMLILMLSLLACKAAPAEAMDDDGGDDPVEFADIEQIESLNPNTPVMVSGDLKDGEIMTDLKWAALSNVACFPGTRTVEFQGNQVYYQVDIPQGHELFVTVTPTGDRKRINLYGYIHFNGSNTPPLQSCLSCEAGYEIYAGTPKLTKPGEAQDISFAQAVNRDFTALVAVVGAKDVIEGSYDLTFEIKPM